MLNNIKRWFINYAYSWYLGAALGGFGIGFMDWKFFAIIIPTVFLVEMKVFHSKENSSDED